MNILLIFVVLSLIFACGSSGQQNKQTLAPSQQSGDVPRSGEVPFIAGCQIFPEDNLWNTRVDQLPVHSKSDDYIASIGLNTPLHPDFGTEWSGIEIGIPFDVVPAQQPMVPIAFDTADESDLGDRSSCASQFNPSIGCYPIPSNPSIEGGADDHIILLHQGECTLYEVFSARKNSQAQWEGFSGAIWHLDRNEMRPEGMTSADAAGLAILPGLIRYEDIYEKGSIDHAIRVTMETVQSGYIRPASHSDGTAGQDPNRAPMGLRMRLKADYDISRFSQPIQIILKAMKTYGLVVADTGGDMFVSGTHDDRWDDSLLHQLERVKASDFEALYTGDIIPYP